MSLPVLVIGGGITGLCAAWEVARAGVPVIVAEASDRFGGKVRTERVDGLVIEHGPDSFVSYRPGVLRLLADLGMTDEVMGVHGSRTVHVRAEGRLRPLPDGMGMVLPTRLRPLVTTPLLTPAQKARAAADLVLPRRLGPGDVSIGALLRARLGDGVADRLAEPLLGGIYGAGVDDLSLDAVLPSLRTAEREHRSLILASLAQGRAARAAGRAGGSPFRTLRSGMSALPERIVADLAEMGADLRLRTVVTALAPPEGYGDGAPSGPAGRVLATFDDGAVRPFAAVVLAVPALALADLLAPGAPQAAAALREIQQTSTTVVTLAYPETAFATVPRSHGWLEAGPAPVSGVTVSSAKWAGRAPDGAVLLRAFVPQRRGDLHAASTSSVARAVAGHVSSVLGAAGPPGLVRVTRWTGAMPVYGVGHPERVTAVAGAVARLPGWHVAGSALHGVGLPDCVSDGRRAGQDVLRDLGAVPAQA